MSRMILVPIDISDKEFTERIISHVESEARIDDAEVHFLSVIPALLCLTGNGLYRRTAWYG